MTDVTFQFTFRVGGTLTNATSVVLSDAGGTYGAKRLDTDAIVVASGTAMTTASTGVYRYTFTPPAQGLAYSWVARVVYNGVTYHFEQEAEDPANSGDGGYYADEDDLVLRVGPVALNRISNEDGTSTSRNADRVAAALAFADLTIDRYLRKNGNETPIDTDSTDFSLLTESAANLAIAWLYGLREWRESDDGTSQDPNAHQRNNHAKAGGKILRDFGIFGLDADRNSPDDPIVPVVVA